MTAMAHKARWQWEVTHTPGQKQSRCHSDCHEGVKMCQVFSQRGGKKKTKGKGWMWSKCTKYYRNTHLEPNWQAAALLALCSTHTHTHRQWSDATDKYSSKGHAKVPEHSLTASLFFLCWKPAYSEFLLVNSVLGWQGGWRGLAENSKTGFRITKTRGGKVTRKSFNCNRYRKLLG